MVQFTASFLCAAALLSQTVFAVPVRIAIEPRGATPTAKQAQQTPSNSNYQNSYSSYQPSSSSQENNEQVNNYGQPSSNYNSNSNYNNYESSSNNNNYESNSNNYAYDSNNVEQNNQYSSNYDQNNYDNSNQNNEVNSYNTPSYGSGSSYSSNNYNDCVQQCMATFGSLSDNMQPPPPPPPPSLSQSNNEVSSGSVTQTVMVAPTAGVNLYFPPIIQAAPGTVIEFVWGNQSSNHTVTKSTPLTPCNKTQDNLFASGFRVGPNTFTITVNDTTPISYYCGFGTHCENGMFGLINGPTAAGTNTSVASMMPSILAANPQMQDMYEYAMEATANNTGMATWGGAFDLSSLPPQSQGTFVNSILVARVLMANNPVTYNNGTITPVSNMVAPTKLLALLANSSSTPSPAVPAAAAAAAASSPSQPSTSSSSTPGGYGSSPNGARSVIASSSVFAGLVALVATVFVL